MDGTSRGTAISTATAAILSSHWSDKATWLSFAASRSFSEEQRGRWRSRESSGVAVYGGPCAVQRRSYGDCLGAAGKGTEGEMTGDEGADDGESGRHAQTRETRRDGAARRVPTPRARQRCQSA
jgi:hypothetical protein